MSLVLVLSFCRFVAVKGFHILCLIWCDPERVPTVDRTDGHEYNTWNGKNEEATYVEIIHIIAGSPPPPAHRDLLSVYFASFDFNLPSPLRFFFFHVLLFARVSPLWASKLSSLSQPFPGLAIFWRRVVDGGWFLGGGRRGGFLVFLPGGLTSHFFFVCLDVS